MAWAVVASYLAATLWHIGEGIIETGCLKEKVCGGLRQMQRYEKLGGAQVDKPCSRLYPAVRNCGQKTSYGHLAVLANAYESEILGTITAHERHN